MSYKDLVRQDVKLVSVLEDHGGWGRMIHCGEMPKDNA